MRRVLWLLSFAAWISVSAVSFAQDEAEEDDALGADEAGDASEAAPAPADEAEPEADAKPADAAASGAGPTWWIGPFVEGVVVPSFLLKLILDASPTVFNPAFGAAITRRNPDGVSWVLGLGYSGYGFDGPFRLSGDPELDTEYVDSNLGLLNVRGMLLWTATISKAFAFEYGVGIELGVVLGSMKRTEAYRDAGGNYHACTAPLTPDLSYCEPPTNPILRTNAYNEDGAHYGVTEERVPPVAAALMIPALALRYAPIDKLAIKIEASFGLMQFTFGLSAAYALDG